jgi:lysophospholipase L1-like esterase
VKPFFRPLLLILLNFITAGCRRDPTVPALNGRPVVLCAGDSITAASYPKLLRELLERDGFRVQVINAGVKGDNTAEYIRFLDRSLIIERSAPRWVLLQLGTNDLRIDSHATATEQFEKNLEAIIERFSRHRLSDGSVPEVILATIPPIPLEVPWHFSARSRARVEAEINPAIRAVARRRKLMLADVHEIFSSRPHLLPDIHPSEDGYLALAEMWRRILRERIRGAGATSGKKQ